MSLAIWKDLEEHHKILVNREMRELFASDSNRFSKLSLQVSDILLDYSKQRVTEETLNSLCVLAEALGLAEQIEGLFSGELINSTEQRPALHTALREITHTPLLVNGQDIKQPIHTVLTRMEQWIESLQGMGITDIISLGIGGSDLGPVMVCEALNQYKSPKSHALNLHFISNVDGHTLARVFSKCNAHTTACIINSKTFTTPETLQNANVIKTWFNNTLGKEKTNPHLIAVTANKSKALAFGISEKNIFELWDFVGGRYSVWSAVGLPIAVQLGMDKFKDFLAGAREMDLHFAKAPFDKNMPVLMALLGIWNINFGGARTQAIIPYEDGLQRLPAYLQQLEMESNGKSVDKQGKKVDKDTCPVIWGGVGCNGQHAYMQLLHQGTQVIPVDFLIAAQGHPDFEEHHQLLVASCLSQSKALMEGTAGIPSTSKGSDALAFAKYCPGSRPSNTLMYPKLTPKVLGALIALYEHKVFVQGVLWGINSFDQFGVELGKTLAKEILPLIQKDALTHNKSDIQKMDSSTLGLMNFFKKWK